MKTEDPCQNMINNISGFVKKKATLVTINGVGFSRRIKDMFVCIFLKVLLREKIRREKESKFFYKLK